MNLFQLALGCGLIFVGFRSFAANSCESAALWMVIGILVMRSP
jgi:hypothetical protein